MTNSRLTMKPNNLGERIVFRLTAEELRGIDAKVAAAKERGEKSNRSIIARQACKELLTA